MWCIYRVVQLKVYLHIFESTTVYMLSTCVFRQVISLRGKTFTVKAASLSWRGAHVVQLFGISQKNRTLVLYHLCTIIKPPSLQFNLPDMTSITFNNLSKADGSALIDHRNSIVQATVFGPVDVPLSRMNYEEAVVDILYKPKVSIPSTSPAFDYVREIENLLQSIFKEVILTRLHPRTMISILVQEIHKGDSLVSAIINAVCCALLDAGVPMRSPVAAVTLKESHFVFDNDYNLLTILTKSPIDDTTLRSTIELAQKEAKDSLDIMRKQVRERFTD